MDTEKNAVQLGLLCVYHQDVSYGRFVTTGHCIQFVTM